MLTVSDLTCGYGDVLAVRNLSFRVSAGEIFAILGANGAGKTTAIMCIAGHVPPTSGVTALGENDITREPAHRRIHHGLALVPEGRRIFPDLTVDENLIVGGHITDRRTLTQQQERVYSYFPRLAERKRQAAGSLSGGEQQMLAIGRALISEPRLIMIDELSLGLMPKIVDACYDVLDRLRGEGLGILLVEQNTTKALEFADRVCVMESGHKSWEGTKDEAVENSVVLDAYLGTATHG